MFKDLLWFLGLLIGLFFIWVYMGGPEKARQKDLKPTITQPISIYGNNSTQKASTQSSVKAGEIRVNSF